MGDAVLQCIAKALNPGNDKNLSAFRRGGEEFLIMSEDDVLAIVE